MIHLDPAVGRESSAAFGTSVVPEGLDLEPRPPRSPAHPGALEEEGIRMRDRGHGEEERGGEQTRSQRQI